MIAEQPSLKEQKELEGTEGKCFPFFTSYGEQGDVVPPFQEISR